MRFVLLMPMHVTTIGIIDITISITRSMAEPTLRQMRMFLAVARCASFRAAADAVAASQSGLSVQIKALEDRVGMTLFDRTTRTVRLTAAGTQLLPEVARLVDAADELRHRSAQIAAGQTGRLRIAALPSMAQTILPEAVTRLRRHHPEVRIHIVEAIEQELVAALKAGRCDLGLTSARMLEHGMTFESLYRDELVAVMPPSHPLAAQPHITVAALADQALILTRRATSLRLAIERAFADAGTVAVPAYEVGHMTTALSFAASGLGIALLPASVARSMYHQDLVTRALDAQAGARTMGILHWHASADQPLQRRFVTLLHDAVAAVVPPRLRVKNAELALGASPPACRAATT